ncbi:hypothetical protein EPB74_12720 [Psychrobacter sp. DAB_AL62B]|nr:hypothetical protein [Psychrobacter sp. DAB_AL62B]
MVNHNFNAHRTNQLWVADFTYIKTLSGWEVSDRMNTDLVMAALEQAIADRDTPKDVIHHSDRGVQYLSIRYTERVVETAVIASVGTTGDSYDNALAETVNGLYKSEPPRDCRRLKILKEYDNEKTKLYF